jgi:hypothetical protein
VGITVQEKYQEEKASDKRQQQQQKQQHNNNNNNNNNILDQKLQLLPDHQPAIELQNSH